MKKKMTIDDLAIIVNKGFQDAADFRNDMIEFRKEVVEEFERVHADIHDLKTALGPLVRVVAAQDREIQGLHVRVERLERKVGLGK